MRIVSTKFSVYTPSSMVKDHYLHVQIGHQRQIVDGFAPIPPGSNWSAELRREKELTELTQGKGTRRFYPPRKPQQEA